jgi:ankyrin repeat protein
LLATMIRSRNPKLMEYVAGRLIRDRSLVNERYAGRTLLHEAAAAGAALLVELLLQLGADPRAKTGGGHTPLYSLGNECAVPGCGRIVRLLVEAGADVNAADGVKHCTPLHMAARRGNTEVAKALLDCGANIEARDSVGHTPLRRALNCRKPGVAELLTARSSQVAG